MTEENIIEFIKRKNAEFDAEQQRRKEIQIQKEKEEKEEKERKQAECDSNNEKEVKPIIIKAVSDYIWKNYRPNIGAAVYYEELCRYICINDNSRGEHIPIPYKQLYKRKSETIAIDIVRWLTEEFGEVFDIIAYQSSQYIEIKRKKST